VNQPFLQNRKPHGFTFLKLGIALIVLLLFSALILSYFYVNVRNQNEALLKQVQETQKKLDQLQISLAQGDLKKAFTDLAQAQKNIAALLPQTPEPAQKPLLALNQQPVASRPTTALATKPTSAATAPSSSSAQPSAKTVPAKPPPVVIPATLTLAANESPFPLVLAEAGEYLLICEKDQNTLHLFRFVDNRFALVKSYPCIVGANGLDKKKAGDLATPVGNYFFLRYIPGKSLSEKYGYGAFVLNYPNFLDRKDRKDGTGIWLHGHTPGKGLGEQELQNTSGCVVVSNDVLKELTGLLKANGTPMAVVNRLQLTKVEHQRHLSEELNTFMKSWGRAWESADTVKFMSYYSHDFINGDGMNYQAFKRQKERVNSGKKFIRVKIENPAILLPQEKGGQIAIVRFMQIYRSNNFESDSKKLFYLKKGPAGWQIIGESRL
jgi:murein L,D-transpeptidase YafK/type II secretory pathway pseudopilin PulG